MTGKEYRTITDVKGPLVFLNKTEPVSYGEIVQLMLTDGSIKNGQVLDTSDDQVIVQVFEGTASVDRQTGVKFLGDVFSGVFHVAVVASLPRCACPGLQTDPVFRTKSTKCRIHCAETHPWRTPPLRSSYLVMTP